MEISHKHTMNGLICTLSFTDKLWYNFVGFINNYAHCIFNMKRITIIMLGLGPRSSCRDGFKKLGILRIPSLYIFAMMMFVVRNPDHFKTNSSTHSTDTRQKKKSTTFTISEIFFNSKGCHKFLYKNI
jgi:hypothetical protein